MPGPVRPAYHPPMAIATTTRTSDLLERDEAAGAAPHRVRGGPCRQRTARVRRRRGGSREDEPDAAPLRRPAGCAERAVGSLRPLRDAATARPAPATSRPPTGYRSPSRSRTAQPRTRVSPPRWSGPIRRHRSSSFSRTSTKGTRRRSTCCACWVGGWAARPCWRSQRSATTSSTACIRCGSSSASSPRRTQCAVWTCGRSPRDAVATLAAGTDVAPGAVHDLTAGNPFYVTELLATGGTTVPDTVRDLVLARVATVVPAGDGGGRGDVDRPTRARRRASPRGMRRGGRFRGRMPCERRPARGRRRRRVPPRALPRGRRGVVVAGAAARTSPVGVAGAHGRTARACRPRTDRTSRHEGR